MSRCPVCGGPSRGRFPARYGARPTVAGRPIALPAVPCIERCADCGARWTVPPPPPEALSGCYEAAGAAVWHDDEQSAERRGFAARVARVEREAPRASALEVGCYTGGFLSRLPSDWRRVGLEPSSAAAEVARRRGLEVHTQDVLAATLPEASFGVAVAFDVIEHLVQPDAFVDRLRGWLAPGGLLLVETGDADSRFARLMGAHWSYYHLPEHVLFYTPEAIGRLLRRHGFEIREVERGRHSKRPRLLLQARRALVAGLHVAATELSQRALAERSPLMARQVPWLLHRDHMLVWARRG